MQSLNYSILTNILTHPKSEVENLGGYIGIMLSNPPPVEIKPFENIVTLDMVDEDNFSRSQPLIVAYCNP